MFFLVGLVFVDTSLAYFFLTLCVAAAALKAPNVRTSAQLLAPVPGGPGSRAHISIEGIAAIATASRNTLLQDARLRRRLEDRVQQSPAPQEHQEVEEDRAFSKR